MPRSITPATSLDSLKKEAKRWLRALRDDDAHARARLERVLPNAAARPVLREVQHAIALEFGLPGWTALKKELDASPLLRRYERIADALVLAYRTADPDAMRIVWDYFGHGRTWDVMRRYIRLDLGKTERPDLGDADDLTRDEACDLVARAQDFDSWDSLARFALAALPGRVLLPKAAGLFAAATDDSRRVIAKSRDWGDLIGLLKETRAPGVHASGQMTDDALEHISRFDHVTSLELEGSRALTDDGVRHLARMPQLRHLNLMGCGITDRGLAVLRRLPALESIVLSWTRTTDAGAIHLAACDQLRRVDLSATKAGDEAIRALAGKRHLAELRSGNAVTDRGLGCLAELPVFKTWHGGDEAMALLRPTATPNTLSLRGVFTDRGMSALSSLHGLFALDLDNDQLLVTGAGLARLRELPHLTWLGFDAKDDSMPHVAALPHLRFLMCQDTTAGDDGFVALSRSQSIEHIWGRRCHNLRRRGFKALADMPRLRYLSVSCKNVDDQGVSALPRFPALAELMPMDIPDEGYRHIARCPKLVSLVLMYCRDTTDRATEHIAAMPTLTKYFASYTRITDRTPELLSGVSSLEEVSFDSCPGLTNGGIAALTRLPRLRKVSVGGMRRVTTDVAAAFPSRVEVRHFV